MNWLLSFVSHNWIAGFVLQLISSDQFQSLERTALKSVGVWLTHIGLTSTDATTASTAFATGIITFATGIIGSLRANSTAGAPASGTATTAANTSKPATAA